MTGLGPNDVEPCGTEACRRWHLARGRDHVCGRDEPAAGRMERGAETIIARLVRRADWRSRRWPAVLADDDPGVA